MPIQFPAKGYNPDPITRAQKFSHNALVNDANQLQNKANQQGFDQANAQKGKETLYNMATQTLKFIEQAGGDAVGGVEAVAHVKAFAEGEDRRCDLFQ